MSYEWRITGSQCIYSIVCTDTTHGNTLLYGWTSQLHIQLGFGQWTAKLQLKLRKWEQYSWNITLNPEYTMLALFATSLLASNRKKNNLFHGCMSLLNWYKMVYKGNLSYAFFGWNLRIYFPCISNLGCLGIFTEDLLRLEHKPNCLHVCVY